MMMVGSCDQYRVHLLGEQIIAIDKCPGIRRLLLGRFNVRLVDVAQRNALSPELLKYPLDVPAAAAGSDHSERDAVICSKSRIRHKQGSSGESGSAQEVP